MPDFTSAVKTSPGGTIILIEVVPNSRKESLGTDEWTGRIKVKVKAKAIKGEANQAVLKKFSHLLGCDVSIIRGELSRKKTLSVKMDKDKVVELLRPFF